MYTAGTHLWFCMVTVMGTRRSRLRERGERVHMDPRLDPRLPWWKGPTNGALPILPADLVFHPTGKFVFYVVYAVLADPA